MKKIFLKKLIKINQTKKNKYNNKIFTIKMTIIKKDRPYLAIIKRVLL